MKQFKKSLIIAGSSLAILGLAGFTANEVGAEEYTPSTWTARSTDEVKADLTKAGDGSLEYTVQWGDTLSVLAAATGLPLDSLQQVNSINNADMIYSGTVIRLSADQTVVSVESEGTKKSFDVSTQEVHEVEAPAETVVEAPVEAPATEVVEEVTAPAASSEAGGYSLTVNATAYSYQETGLTNYTADGTNLLNDSRVIAVDPSVIPLGSWVEIPGYGTYRAADTGGAIVGNKIDIHFNNLQDVYNFGRQTITIKVLN